MIILGGSSQSKYCRRDGSEDMTDHSDMPQNFPSIASAFFSRAQAEPDRILYSQFVRTDSHTEQFNLETRTYAESALRVKALAVFFRKVGVKPGDSVAILSATRPEWIEADMAILSIGAVSVSLYASLIDSEIAYLLYDSRAQVVVVENSEQLEKVLTVIEKENLIPATEDRPALHQKVLVRQIVSFEATMQHSMVTPLNEIFEEGLTQAASQFDAAWFENIKSQDLASIVYTSGTTGPQKGVIQSHGNHLANVRQAKQGKMYSENSKIFLLLPLAHSFAKLMAYIGLVEGVHLQFPSISDTKSSRANQRRMLLDLSQCECSVIPLVPRILEKMKEGIEFQASRTGLKALLLRLTLFGARRTRNSVLYPLQMLVFAITGFMRRTIRRKLFGNKFWYVISGGAKLPPEVNLFFDGLEIEVLEGYGLTETCVATNCNPPGGKRVGTVGPLLAEDIELKFAPDGEILFRGPNVSTGYLNQPSATRRSWDGEGWFHTGDLGSLDASGYLVISGRKKEILVTSGGKKISPEKIENAFKTHDLISQAILIGEGRPYCVALLAAERERLTALVPVYKVESADDILRLPEIARIIKGLLDQVNRGLASFETVKRVMLIQREFTIENGCLTPTLKMRRGPIAESYKREIEQLYQSTEEVLVEGQG